MRYSLSSSKASNWVDRGESPLPVLKRTLTHFFACHDERHQPWLQECAECVLGMVAADATEVHIVGYLKFVAGEQDLVWPANARHTVMALWHISKAALVRDVAQRLLNGEIEPADTQQVPLSRWLASKLLTAEELAEYEALGNESPYAPRSESFAKEDPRPGPRAHH